jgi:carbamoyltransferase
MRVLGFSVGHDKGAVIIENGRVVIGISQERLTRIKHDGGLQGGKIPVESINYCLNSLSLTHKDIDLFVYSTTEEIELTYEQLSHIPQGKLFYIPHHFAHACSTFFSSGFEEAAVVVADASGSILNLKNKTHEWYNPEDFKLDMDYDWCEAMSIFHFDKKNYKEVFKKWMKYPIPWNDGSDISVGQLYSEGSWQLVYDDKTNSWNAGKLMGLASYADDWVVDAAPEIVITTDDTIFIPNNRIYPKVNSKTDFYSKAGVAGIYQRQQEKSIMWLSKKAKELTGSQNFCGAGGSFLNCNSNQLIEESEIFDNCYFIPSSDDSGIPLGCAWWGYQQLAEIENKDFISPYFGKEYKREDIISAINEFTNIQFIEYDNFDELIEKTLWFLKENRVIGWFQGGSEFGPRALGNRSLLASPIKSWMTNHINSDIKGREWYRPFAPSVLFEHQRHIFESDNYSPYMLVTTKVKEDWIDKIPAVVHIDGTARLQSVTEDNNPKFYKLLTAFYNLTGVPVLLNTSFNGPHEPIVETPKEAIKTFLDRNVDVLVINNFLIQRI